MDINEYTWFGFEDVIKRRTPISRERCVSYCLRNTVNGKLYVGKTINMLYERLRGHAYDAIVNKSTNIVHRAIRKYGAEAFVTTILERVDNPDELCDTEVRLVATLGSFGGGYNMTKGGEGVHGHVKTPEERKKISDMRRGVPCPQSLKDALHKPIEQYDITTGETLFTFASYTEAAQTTGIANITWACRGRLPHAGGFGWRYVNDDDLIRGSWSPEARQKMKERVAGKSPLYRPVDQIGPETDTIVATFPSIKEAYAATNICNISMVCRGVRHIAGGFRWKYHDGT